MFFKVLVSSSKFKMHLLKTALQHVPEGPLNGILVVEIGQHVSGPLLGSRLARKGAFVIKIEKPGVGDPARNYMSKEIFNSINAGKVSIAIDGKENKALFIDILKMADVIIDNRSPEAKENDEALNEFLDLQNKHQPVIFCSIVGYEGEENKHLLALDVAVQARTGMTHVNGAHPNQPLKVGFVVLDEVTAIEASDLIASHLFTLSRGKKVPKQHNQVIRLVVNMAGVSAYLMQGQILNCLTTNAEPSREGNRDNWLSPFSLYEAKNGLICIAIIDDSQFKRFCLGVLDNKEFLEKYSKLKMRMDKINEFEMALSNILKTKDARYWLDRCNKYKVPASFVNTVSQALQEPFFRNIISTTKSGIRIVGDPYVSSLYPRVVLEDAPSLNGGEEDVRLLVEKFKELLGLSVPVRSTMPMSKL